MNFPTGPVMHSVVVEKGAAFDGFLRHQTRTTGLADLLRRDQSGSAKRVNQ
jgi:hypothetical protein